MWAHYSDGTSQLLVNNIGAYSGQAVLNNPKKTNCYLKENQTGSGRLIGIWRCALVPGY